MAVISDRNLFISFKMKKFGATSHGMNRLHKTIRNISESLCSQTRTKRSNRESCYQDRVSHSNPILYFKMQNRNAVVDNQAQLGSEELFVMSFNTPEIPREHRSPIAGSFDRNV
jgi:hypothetical protein